MDHDTEEQNPKLNEKMKLMVGYVHEHFGEKITIKKIAAAAYISERECYRSFHAVMHMTPNEYVKQYRLQVASRMLTDSNESINNIAQVCGLGTSSFFGKVFRESFALTPLEYRKKNKVKSKPPAKPAGLIILFAYLLTPKVAFSPLISHSFT